MHKLRSITSVIRFRCVALLLCAILLSAAASLIILAIAIHRIDRNLAGVGIAFGAFAMVCGAMRSLFAGHTCCPLCLTPVLSGRHCAKHRRARSLLGSHSLRVAISILSRNSFRCPYCNELTAVKARHRHEPSYPRRRR